MNLKKLERYLRLNLLGPGPRLIKKEFTGPRSNKGWETLVYSPNEWSPIKFARIQQVFNAPWTVQK